MRPARLAAFAVVPLLAACGDGGAEFTAADARARCADALVASTPGVRGGARPTLVELAFDAEAQAWRCTFGGPRSRAVHVVVYPSTGRFEVNRG